MASEPIAKEVKALHSIEKLSQRTFSETAHIIQEDDTEQLVKALSKQGYTVRVEQS